MECLEALGLIMMCVGALVYGSGYERKIGALTVLCGWALVAGAAPMIPEAPVLQRGLVNGVMVGTTVVLVIRTAVDMVAAGRKEGVWKKDK